MAEKNWKKAVELRGKVFNRNVEILKRVSRLKPPKKSFKDVNNLVSNNFKINDNY